MKKLLYLIPAILLLTLITLSTVNAAFTITWSTAPEGVQKTNVYGSAAEVLAINISGCSNTVCVKNVSIEQKATNASDYTALTTNYTLGDPILFSEVYFQPIDFSALTDGYYTLRVAAWNNSNQTRAVAVTSDPEYKALSIKIAVNATDLTNSSALTSHLTIPHLISSTEDGFFTMNLSEEANDVRISMNGKNASFTSIGGNNVNWYLSTLGFASGVQEYTVDINGTGTNDPLQLKDRLEIESRSTPGAKAAAIAKGPKGINVIVIVVVLAGLWYFFGQGKSKRRR